MPSALPVFSLRIQEEALEKIRFISASNKRSINKELEYVIDRYIASYEAEHGEIKLSEE